MTIDNLALMWCTKCARVVLKPIKLHEVLPELRFVPKQGFTIEDRTPTLAETLLATPDLPSNLSIVLSPPKGTIYNALNEEKAKEVSVLSDMLEYNPKQREREIRKMKDKDEKRRASALLAIRKRIDRMSMGYQAKRDLRDDLLAVKMKISEKLQS